MDVKFPDVTVKLVGTNSNAFALMASVNAALRKAGYGSAIFSGSV
jgi:hypothetical protein